MSNRIDSSTGFTPMTDQADAPEETMDSEEEGGGATDRIAGVFDDAIETAEDVGRQVKEKWRDAQGAFDLDERIEALGPQDSLRVRVAGSGRLLLGGSASEALDIKRLDDGRYTVAVSGELAVSYGYKLEKGQSALAAVGVDQAAVGKLEFTCADAREAAEATRALRNAQLRQLGVPLPGRGEDTVTLAKTLSAVELGGKNGVSLEGKLEVFGASAEGRAGLKVDNSARLEFGKDSTWLVVKGAVAGDVSAPLKVSGLFTGEGGATATAGLNLGQPLRAGVRVETETRVPLEGGVAEALARAKTRVTFSSEARAAAGVWAAGREARVSVELGRDQAQQLLVGVATADASQVATVLQARASAEVRPFSEQGGEAGFSLGAGPVGAGVGFEARTRDVRPEQGVKVKADLGVLLSWLVAD